MSEQGAPFAVRVARAKVLVEAQEMTIGELLTAELLDEDPDNRELLSLMGKIKHVRGELSAALTFWSRAYQRTDQGDSAQARLGALLHFAQEPQDGPSEFMPAGPFQLAKKSAAQVKLEAAFREFVAREPDRARDKAREVGRQFSADPQTYKLAMMSAAWFSEMSGDLQGAMDELEALGNDARYTTDPERLTALARVYERDGSPSKLTAAARIYEHLQEDKSICALATARFAALSRQLGDTEAANLADARFAEHFRQDMHRPNRAEAAQAAAHEHIPLHCLRAVSIAGPKPNASAGPREHAVAAALDDQLDVAIAEFEQRGQPIDQCYLGDLYEAKDDPQQALVHYIRAYEGGARQWHLLSAVLSSRVGPQSEFLRRYFSDPVKFDKAKKLLQTTIRNSPTRSDHWHRLSNLYAIIGDEATANKYLDRASIAAQAHAKEANPIGRAQASAVYRFAGSAIGLIHQLWADRERTAPGKGGALPMELILGNLTPQMRQGVRNTFLATREYALSRYPHLTTDLADYHYSYKVTKEDEPSGGLSAGLPTALVFLSVFLRRPIPQDMTFTGTAVADSHNAITIGPVGDCDIKVKGAYNRNLRRVLLPSRNRHDVEHSTQLPLSIANEMVTYVQNLDEAIIEVFGDDFEF